MNDNCPKCQSNNKRILQINNHVKYRDGFYICRNCGVEYKVRYALNVSDKQIVLSEKDSKQTKCCNCNKSTMHQIGNLIVCEECYKKDPSEYIPF